MKHGVCSDGASDRHLPCRMQEARYFAIGKAPFRCPAVTLSWLEWLLEKGERNSRCYDFVEARPVWEMWWFRIVLALAVCQGLVWFLWLRSG